MFTNERKSFIPLLKHVKQVSIQGESGDFIYIYIYFMKWHSWTPDLEILNDKSTILRAGFERRRARL